MPLANPSHLLGATRHSMAGLVAAWKGEQAFRHEVIVLGIMAFILFFTAQPALHWLLVLGGWLFVMVVELLNSAVEKACDAVTLERHPLIKAAKDMASAAIFLALCMNVLLWFFLLFRAY